MMSDIMTPKEVAEYLKMSVLTVYKHAKQGTIPGFRVGNSWRFDKRQIDAVLLRGEENPSLQTGAGGK
ncbi:MAG: helix-turn-helix domain-containing protein [Deltaproteobacteria bacterium]|nr:helix-turn-helix domain-containing protein [Deltaproteobacteria bacterium]